MKEMTEKKNIILLDGAVGTSLWEKSDDKVSVWRYNLEKPEIVLELHREYIAAGAKIILANTFGANSGAVKRSPYAVEEVVRAGVRLAKQAVQGTDVKVALSAGPLSVLLEPYGDLTEEECEAIYEEQLGAGMQEGADLIMLQTFMDAEMMRIAATVAKRYNVPVFCTMTFTKVGKTMMGNSVDDVLEALEPLGIDAVGMNCSLGPDLAVPIIEEFARKTKLPIVFKPNAGLPILAPDGTTETVYTPDIFVKDVRPVLPLVTYIGGCCGCNASYVEALRTELEAEG